jgi:hypothetical protein
MGAPAVLGGGDQRIAGARHRGIDQREAVVLTHEVRVDEAVAGELDETVVERVVFMGSLSVCADFLM